ncbi:hypothetical protein [Aeromonas caviae]|jgi:hypothetical protein|uniref:hypothetical protein n=1 Tax=Aeromonas caviae TaxID=648 RepID=UPI00385BB5F3
MTVTAYHGTPHTFERFRVPSSGLHFGTREQAIHACTLKLARLPTKQFGVLIPDHHGWRGRVIKANLHLTNAKRVNDARTPAGWAKVIKKAKQEGYDGLIYKNTYEGRDDADSYVVFDANQVEVVPGDS